MPAGCGRVESIHHTLEHLNKAVFFIAFSILLLNIPGQCSMPDPYEGNFELFWGDIHCHSTISDGAPVKTPFEELRMARDVAGLDFAALTDHAEWMFVDLSTFYGFGIVDYSEEIAEEKWREYVNTENALYTPGEFVTLIGYEWSSEEGGHRTVYFESDGSNVGLRPLGGLYHSLGSQLSKASVSEVIYLWPDIPGDYDRPSPVQLWESLEEDGFTEPGNRVITVPHHPVGPVPVDWETYRNDDFDRVVEIYSKHGNAEKDGCYEAARETGDPWWSHSVANAIAGGREMGFIASTDSHGHMDASGYTSWIPAFPGSISFPEHDWRDDLYGREFGWRHFSGGLTGVWVEKQESSDSTLTREGVFSAIYDRRTVATTGPRADTRFWLDLDGDLGTFVDQTLAGEERFVMVGDDLHFFIKINLGHSSGCLVSRIVVVKNGEDEMEMIPPEPNPYIETSWFETAPVGRTSWYLRIEINDPQNFDHDSYIDPVSGITGQELQELIWTSPIFISTNEETPVLQ